MWLSLARPLLGTWPETQACALDLELKQRPFDWQAGAQSTEPHQPGLLYLTAVNNCKILEGNRLGV